MTSEEKIAFEYGKTFDTAVVPEGFKIACCFDKRINTLVRNRSNEIDQIRTYRNMRAWSKGLNSTHTNN